MNIRRANPTDRDVLVDIWLRSVRAMHTFLSAPALHRLSVPGLQHQCRIQSDRYAGAFGASQTAHDDPGADLVDRARDHGRAGDQYVVSHATYLL